MSEAIGQPWPENTHRLRLGEVEFDLRYRSIRREGRVHELSQRCFDLLLLFLREPYLLHTREEIFRRVWAGVVVEDANITTCIWVLRKALGSEAKAWIRTVSRQGYVFDPPNPLEPVAANDPIVHEASAPAASEPNLPSLPVVAAPGVDTLPRLARPIVASAALVLLAALLIVLFVIPRPHQPSTRITLVPVIDASLNSETRWPTELLHAWIEWQLESRNDLLVVADASAERDGGDTIVLLSAAVPVGRDGEWRIRAHVRESGDGVNFDRNTTPERMLATIDEVSRDVVRQFMPDVAASALPSLAMLDVVAAPHLVDALVAERRGRWNEAVDAYRKVLDIAPDFGFAHMHLATALAQLGQSNAAQAELALAERWIARLPAPMQPQLQARAIAIRQDYLAAARRFGELAENSIGNRLDLRLEEAANLRRGGRSRDALERLSGALPASPTQALAWLIERATTELATLDVARARASATEAIKLARSLGWDQDRANATLVLIDGMAWSGLSIDDALYDDAIAGFRGAGDEIGMLRATVMREIRDTTGDADVVAHLDKLLAEARAAGNASAEIDALRRVGQRHLSDGDTHGARERLKQAEAIAESAGDRFLQRQISANLLRVDSWRGDFTAVEKRIADLRAEPLQGGLAFIVGLSEARLHFRRGRYDAALTTLAATEEQLRIGEPRGLPQIAAGLDCMRATVFIRLGRTADATTATNACAASQVPYYVLYAEAGKAELAILAGDTGSATASLVALADRVLNQPSRIDAWLLVAEIAPLLARVGEIPRALALIEAVAPALERSGFAGTELDVRAAAAEIALARGHIDDAQQRLEQAQRLLHPEDWFTRHRLQSVAALIRHARNEHVAAAPALARLHDEARDRGDVLAELLIHSVADVRGAGLCTPDRHARLLAQSGMRGANFDWLVAAPLHAAAARLTSRLTRTPTDKE